MNETDKTVVSKLYLLQSNDGSTVCTSLFLTLFLHLSISHVKLFPLMADKNKLERNICNFTHCNKMFWVTLQQYKLVRICYILLNSMESTNPTVFLAKRNCKLQQCCEFSGSPLRTRQPSNQRTDTFVTGWFLCTCAFFVWFKCVCTKFWVVYGITVYSVL